MDVSVKSENLEASETHNSMIKDNSQAIPVCLVPDEDSLGDAKEPYDSNTLLLPSTYSVIPRNSRLNKKVEDNNSDSFALSTSLPPWEYLVDHSNKSKSNNESKPKNSTSVHYLDRLAYLLNSIDSVLERLKCLVQDTCTLTSLNESDSEQNKIRNETVILNDSIVLSDKLSYLLTASNGTKSKLLILHQDQLNKEFSRCSSVVESISELFFLMKNDSYVDIDVNDLVTHDDIKEEDIALKLEEDINPTATEKTPKQTKKSGDKRKRKKVISECYSEGEISDLDESHDGNDLNGFSPEFSISQEEYHDILQKGKPYTCSACQKPFNSRKSFRSHLKNKCVGESIEHLKAKWKKENNMFTCLAPGCGKAWKRKETLYSHHQKEHLQGVICPFKCDQCDKTFYMRGLLNNHNKEDHQTTFCELCGKAVKGKMKLHMMRHTGDKPHKCQYCDYSAISSGQVKNHTILVHENHKLPLHFCDICGKDFKLKGHLKEHILTHSDKRTYLCKICGKYLKNPNSYRRHMVSVHKVSHGYVKIANNTWKLQFLIYKYHFICSIIVISLIYRCSVCGVEYFTLKGLQFHQQKVHNINPT